MPAVGLPSTPRSRPSSPPPARPLQPPPGVASVVQFSQDSAEEPKDHIPSLLPLAPAAIPPEHVAAIPELVPPRLSITTSSPPVPLSNDSNPLDALPTYDDLASQEPGNARFGRWRGWVDKRARERLEERQVAKAEGRVTRTSWNLHDEQPGEEEGPEDAAGVRESRERDRNAERRISRQPNRVSVTNPDTDMYRDHDNDSPSSSSASSALKGRPGVIPLVASASMHQLGSRFLKQIPEKPRCGAVLPVGLGPKGSASALERQVKGLSFLSARKSSTLCKLVGLYLSDLLPSLGAAPLNTATSASDAVILPLWKGLGVLQLEVYVDLIVPQPRRPTESSRGVVFALVSTPGASESDHQLRMWSLTSLVNLAKWRCYNEASEPVIMSAHPHPHMPRSAGEGPKRSSKAFFKALFVGDTSHSPSGAHPPTESTNTKGKARDFNLPSSRAQDLDSGYVVVGGSRPRSENPARLSSSSKSTCRTMDSQPLSRSSSDVSSQAGLLPPRTSTSTSTHTSTSKSPDFEEGHDTARTLPSEWAHSSVVMPLPRGHGPILFFNLSSVPAKDPEPSAMGDEDTLKNWDASRLFLAVATSRVVYVFESKPSERRSWVLSNEFYVGLSVLNLLTRRPSHNPWTFQAPATPKFITFVQTDPSLSETPRNKRASSASSTSHSAALNDICIFMGTRRESVLIRLSDLQVREIDIDPAARPYRTVSRTSTPSPTNARAIISGVASLVEGRQGIPAGIRGEERKIATGRRVRESSEPSDGHEDAVTEDWIGCDELILSTRSSSRNKGDLTRRLYLLSKGLTTAAVLSPIASRLGGLTADAAFPRPGGGPPPIHLHPIHTFTWPSPVVKVVALLPPYTLAHEVDVKYIHLILIGFTKTGVHVQEGTISKAYLETQAFASSSEAPPHRPRRFFTPTRSHTISPLRSEPTPESVDPELSDTATFDFSRLTGFLCVGDGPWDPVPFTSPLSGSPAYGTGSSDEEDEDEDEPKPVVAPRPRGLFFWTAASDYTLKYIG
ncbi:hypothetical protein P7C70_g3238, partial [Phenoliferia sp. Uapishka_3]